MSLLTQAIESIYKYGNVILNLERSNEKIIFEISETGDLRICFERKFGELSDLYELDIKQGMNHISCLVFYSFVKRARERDKAYLTCDNLNKKEPSQTIKAVNQLYKQVLPALSTSPRNIESFAKNDDWFEIFLNVNQYANDGFETLNIDEIMRNLLFTYKDFSIAVSTACNLWQNLVTAESKDVSEAMNEFYGYLNELYIKDLCEHKEDVLVKFNINYEFLTDKKYITNPAIDCDSEINNLELALLMPTKSAILVGPPGVGKTAIVEGLSYLIQTKQVPIALQDKRILKINASSLISGCTLQGQFEKKLEVLMNYLIENPNIILFIDELHTVIGLGSTGKSNLDLANMMKPYIDRGQVKMIGATTEDEYENYIKADSAFNRRFEKVRIDEPLESKTIKIIQGNIKKLEELTNVRWPFDLQTTKMIVETIVSSTNREHRVYHENRFNPDISLEILEKAFAIALLKSSSEVSIDDVSQAIIKCEYLYEETRITNASDLLEKYGEEKSSKCKVIKFPNNGF